MTLSFRTSPAIKERKNRLLLFYNFINENKDRYPFSQIVALFGFNTGLHPLTVNSYVQQLLDSNIIVVDRDRVVKMVELVKRTSE